MSGNRFETRVVVQPCGCGGEGIIWVRPSDYGDGSGTVEAFCGKHCGIGVNSHVYREPDYPHRKVGLKVVRTWNRAMGARA